MVSSAASAGDKGEQCCPCSSNMWRTIFHEALHAHCRLTLGRTSKECGHKGNPGSQGRYKNCAVHMSRCINSQGKDTEACSEAERCAEGGFIL